MKRIVLLALVGLAASVINATPLIPNDPARIEDRIYFEDLTFPAGIGPAGSFTMVFFEVWDEGRVTGSDWTGNLGGPYANFYQDRGLVFIPYQYDGGWETRRYEILPQDVGLELFSSKQSLWDAWKTKWDPYVDTTKDSQGVSLRVASIEPGLTPKQPAAPLGSQQLLDVPDESNGLVLMGIGLVPLVWMCRRKEVSQCIDKATGSQKDRV